MVAARKAESAGVVNIDYWPIGGARDLWYAKERSVLIEGPAGSGKTIACLQRVHRAATKYAGMRALIVRKTHVSLTASALVTYQRKVLHALDRVRFYGGSQAEPAKFIYPNGSEIVVGGMDQASKIMSTDYDMVFTNEATDFSEDDIEILDTRLRNNVMPYQQMILDCNPGPPTHWLNQRCNAGRTRRILSRHEDNPFLFNPKTQAMTEIGVDYIAALDKLTGVRLQRLRHGLWVAAEGQVYEDWNEAIHLIDQRPLPDYWDRIWTLDWGYINPLVWGCWAIDHDGRLVLEHEIYQTKLLVEDAGKMIMNFWGNRREPIAIIADHDAGDRATFEKATGLITLAAYKDISRGIQMVQSRLRKQLDGQPRLQIMRDTLIHKPDESLRSAGKPTCTAQEFPTYIWEQPKGIGRKGEHPVDRDNHGMDSCRYGTAYLDKDSWNIDDYRDEISSAFASLGLAS